MVTELAKHIPDVSTFAANLVVFLAAIGAAVVGSMAAVKKIKDGWVDLTKATPATAEATTTKTQVIGGLLQDHYGSVMMAENIRDLKGATEDMKDAVCDNTRELREIRHTLARMMDRMDRR